LSKPEKFVCDGLGFFGFGLFNPRVGLTNLPDPRVGFELLSETQLYGQATIESVCSGVDSINDSTDDSIDDSIDDSAYNSIDDSADENDNSSLI
jgi:hypothetical protein